MFVFDHHEKTKQITGSNEHFASHSKPHGAIRLGEREL